MFCRWPLSGVRPSRRLLMTGTVMGSLLWYAAASWHTAAWAEAPPASSPAQPEPLDATAEGDASSPSTQSPSSPDNPAATGGRADDRAWIQPMVQRAQASTVLITVEGRNGRQAGLGTGFVVSADGLIATNLHVIGEARPIRVRFRDGREFECSEVYASDRHLDLAVIRIPASELVPLTLAKHPADELQGRPVIALGHPMGLQHSVVHGVVSGTRTIDGRELIQVAIPIEMGNSGGPLLDAQGGVLGVVTMKSAVTANLGFAVTAQALRALLDHPNPIKMSRWRTIGTLDSAQWKTLFGARWMQQSGRIMVTESGDGFGGRALCIHQRAIPHYPYEVGVYVKLDDEAGAAGLVFGSDEGDRHYGFYPSGGRLRLTRFDGPTVYNWQIVAQLESRHYRPGEWNHLKVRVEKDRLSCFVNDQLVTQHVVPTALTGKAGLAKFRNTHAEFRQFEVAESIGAQIPTPAELAATIDMIDQLQLDDWTPTASIDPFAANPMLGRYALQQRAAQLRQRAQRMDQMANDVHVRAVCQQLATQLNGDQATPNLAHAALLVSRLDNPELDIDAYLSLLGRMATDIHATYDPQQATAEDRLAKLNDYLFAQNGFHGSRTNYYQAANSYLDRLLDDREGLPITLSIIYIELGRQLGLQIDGVGLPGHFVVRFTSDDQSTRLLDVFAGAKPMSNVEARQRIVENVGNVDPSYLKPSPPQSIILRMLRNLQGIAQQADDAEALLRYLEAMVAVAPEEPTYRAMRAVVRHQTGRKQASIEDLDHLLETKPDGINLNTVRELRHRFDERSGD